MGKNKKKTIPEDREVTKKHCTVDHDIRLPQRNAKSKER